MVNVGIVFFWNVIQCGLVSGLGGRISAVKMRYQVPLKNRYVSAQLQCHISEDKAHCNVNIRLLLTILLCYIGKLLLGSEHLTTRMFVLYICEGL